MERKTDIGHLSQYPGVGTGGLLDQAISWLGRRNDHPHSTPREEAGRSEHERALRNVLRMCQDTRIHAPDAITQIFIIMRYVKGVLKVPLDQDFLE